MLNNMALKSRFCLSGPLFEDIHLVDMFLYDSSLFANILVIADSTETFIIDTGSSKSVGAIMNYLYFNKIPVKNVTIIPTHHHFDHIGGMIPLIDYLQKKDSNVRVLSTKLMKPHLLDTEYYEREAKKGFNDTVGEVNPIPEHLIELVDPDHMFEIGESWNLELISTPGHCDDHLSPYLQNHRHESVCFFGEALGINLMNDLYPIPASSAPHFNSQSYRQSIQKLATKEIDMGIFSHFGGVQGGFNVKKTCQNALDTLDKFQNLIQRYYDQDPSTKSITEKMYNRFYDSIATSSLNETLAHQLGFTIVYGFLQDMGLKSRKE